MTCQLSIPQRISISRQLDEGKSYAAIARVIGVHRSTVKREVDRNSIGGIYCPQRAHSLALFRKTENGKACIPPLKTKTFHLTETHRYQRMLPNYRTFRRRLSLYYRERFAEAFRIRRNRKRFYFYTERFISRSFRYKQWKRDHDRARLRLDYYPLTFLQKLWRKYHYIFTARKVWFGKTVKKSEQKQSFRIVKRKLKHATNTQVSKRYIRRRKQLHSPETLTAGSMAKKYIKKGKPVADQQKESERLMSGYTKSLIVLKKWGSFLITSFAVVHIAFLLCASCYQKTLLDKKIRPPIKATPT